MLGVTVCSLHPNCIPGRTRPPATQSRVPRTQQGFATPVTIPSDWWVNDSPQFAESGRGEELLGWVSGDTQHVCFRDPREGAWGRGPR